MTQLSLVVDGPGNPILAAQLNQYRNLFRGNSVFDAANGHGIDNTGGTDVTSAFSSLVSAVPSTGGCIYLAPGTYKGNLVITGRTDILVCGGGSGTIIAPSSGTGIAINQGTRCNIGNLRLSGVNGGATGLNITGDFDSKIFNTHINGQSGDGIVVNGDDATGTEIEFYDVTCRANTGWGYHYIRTNNVDHGGIYLHNFRSLYDGTGTGGMKVESSSGTSTNCFHTLVDVILDGYAGSAVASCYLHNVNHFRATRFWCAAANLSGKAPLLLDGDGYMISIDGAYFVNATASAAGSYNVLINGTMHDVFIDGADFDSGSGPIIAHVHIGSSGANFFLGHYDLYGSAPLTDTQAALYRRGGYTKQMGPVQFETDGAGGSTSSFAFDDITNASKQKYIRNSNGVLQVLNTAFSAAIFEIADDATFRWNGGTFLRKHLSGTGTWNPGAITNGSIATTTVTVTGAAVGDTVAVGFTTLTMSGVLISGTVTSTNTVTVTIHNVSGSTQTPASGTVRADVWQH